MTDNINELIHNLANGYVDILNRECVYSTSHIHLHHCYKAIPAEYRHLFDAKVTALLATGDTNEK
jgi:hypothetical protein